MSSVNHGPDETPINKVKNFIENVLKVENDYKMLKMLQNIESEKILQNSTNIVKC